MTIRSMVILAILPLFLLGCFSDDDGGGGMNDKERAQAAASSSVLTGSIDDPDDDDDDGDGDGSVPTALSRPGTLMDQANCESGSMASDSVADSDVGSPYTIDGTVETLDWTEYDNCVMGTAEYNGYQANGSAETGAVSYSRWAGAQDDALDLSSEFVMDFDGGVWRLAGERHDCQECAEAGVLFANEAFMRWTIEAESQTATIQWGEPDSFFTTSGEMVADTTVEQSVNGLFGFDLEGTPCDFEVTYETTQDLTIENFGTADEIVTSGEMNMTFSDGTSVDVEFKNGDVYVDNQLVDPDASNPCDGAFDIAL